MRIALVCPTYLPTRSYQENVWAEQLAKVGHVVRVITASRSDEPIKRIVQPTGGYEVDSVATRFLPRNTYWARKSHIAVRDFRPDLIVFLGDKTFGLPIMHDRELSAVPVISTFSENLGMHEFDWRKAGISLKQRVFALGFAVLRGGPIRAVIRRSALVVGNTPQAREILLRLFHESERAAIAGKIIDMPLGFSPEHFSDVPELRRKVRDELHVGDADVLVCVSSQFAATKEPYVRLIIDALRRVMDREPALRAIIVGFSDDAKSAAVSQRISAHIDQGAHAERFLKHPFAGRERLCELYNACDIAAFGRASISCQEALGTGLVACFADDGSLNHLVTRDDQGVFFRPGDVDDLSAKLAEAVRIITRHAGPGRHEFRRTLADAARWLGFDRIIQSILEKVQEQPHSRASIMTNPAGADAGRNRQQR